MLVSYMPLARLRPRSSNSRIRAREQLITCNCNGTAAMKPTMMKMTMGRLWDENEDDQNEDAAAWGDTDETEATDECNM